MASDEEHPAEMATALDGPEIDDRTVLVVDDDPVTRARLAHLLRSNGFLVVTAESGEEALVLFERLHFPLVITDWSMPGISGPELCALLRAVPSPLYTYILLLTARTDKDAAALGLESGADDFATKPFDSRELLARLRVGQRLNSMQRRMVETEKRLREMAERDGLTGVLNRRALDGRVQAAFSYFLRGGPPLSLAILDIDHFKSINDQYGHQAGDKVLREVALRIEQNLRAYDTVGRYGGEEFLLVYPDTPMDRGRAAAERIRSIITGTPIAAGESQLKVTVSIGVVTLQPSFRGPLSLAIETADEALYIAKKLGRDRVVASILPTSERVETGSITTELPTEMMKPGTPGLPVTIRE